MMMVVPTMVMVPTMSGPRIVAERPTAVCAWPKPRIVVNPGIVVSRIKPAHGETLGCQERGLDHTRTDPGFAKPQDVRARGDVINPDIVQVPNDQRVRNAQAAQRDQIVRQQWSSTFELFKKRGRHTEAAELRDFVFIVRRTATEDDNEKNEEVSSRHNLQMVVGYKQ